MKPSHHPDAATLMSFAAGSLPTALAAAVAAHLTFCAHCRRELRVMEAMGGVIVRDLPAAALTAEAPATGLHAASAASATQPSASAVPAAVGAEIPFPLLSLIGPSLDALDWSRRGPGLQQHLVKLPDASAGILRVLKAAPGATIPDHGHAGMELTLVLRGAYRDKLGEFRRGDLADLDDGVDHVPVADANDGCICIVASEAEPVFRGLLPRLAQPFLR